MNNETEIKIINDECEIRKIIMQFDYLYSAHARQRHTDNLIRKIIEKAYFIVSMKANEYSGYCAFYANDFITRNAYITLIAVKEDYQGKEIGKQLIEYAINESKKIGMRKITLEVENNNNHAIKLYQKCGFTSLSDSELNGSTFYMSRMI